MDADVAHIHRFTDVPYVIEAPAAKVELAGAAASALAKRGLRVRMEPAAGMSARRYGAMVESIRKDIETRLKPREGYGIDVVDISRPDLEAELARADEVLRGGSKIVKGLLAKHGAFAGGYQSTARGVRCLVVGLSPEIGVERVLSSGSGADVTERSGLDDALFHRMSLTHEVGHCFLGSSEAKADAFAALRMLQDPSVTKESLAAWATWRERDEWTLAETSDDHYTAKAVWSVIERADALRTEASFRDMDFEGLANLADALVDGKGLTLAEEDEITSVRRGIVAGVRSVMPGAKVRDGAIPIIGWLKRHRDLPAVGRVLATIEGAVRGPKVLEPYQAEPGAFRKAVAALAASGDRIAAKVVAAYDKAPTAAEKAATHAEAHGNGTLEKAIPYRYAVTPFVSRVLAYVPADGARLPQPAYAASKTSVQLAADMEPEPSTPVFGR